MPWTDFVTPENLLRAWQMCQAQGRPYSQIIGLPPLEGYAVDMAVQRWGTAFQSAVNAAINGAKNSQQAEQKAGTVLRRWVPSLRQYR